jgi:Putative zinc finger motif, C2HC5-type.
MIENKEILKAELASLLSFDLDDINDVFEPLMEFDSEDDLLEYISALLGEVTEQGKSFAKNFMRFQQGLDVIVTAEDLDGTKKGQSDKSSKSSDGTVAASSLLPPVEDRRNGIYDSKKHTTMPKSPLEEKKMTSSFRKDTNVTYNNEQRHGTSRDKNGKEPAPIHNRREEVRLTEQNKPETLKPTAFKKERKDNNAKTNIIKSVAKLKISDSKRTTKPAKEVRPKIAPPTKPPPPTTPQKGKAKFVCGCFGTVHKPLTNCLHCGRISCEKEGYDYCPFCSFLIEQVKVVPILGEEFDKAVMHKERLLQFDRENASRTIVYDDQADYFQNSHCTWLTEDERKDALSKEEKRRKDLHTIKKHVLNIQF